MTCTTGTGTAPNSAESHLYGSLKWEEIHGGIRIVELLENPQSVTVPSEISGLPVVELGDGCFAGTDRLEQIVLPDTLKRIGRMAFSTCRSLRVLTIPDSVEELGAHMLTDTAVSAVKLPSSLKAIPRCAFSYCKTLRKVEFNDGLQAIGTHAFYSTRVGSEEPLTLPDSVQKIAPGAFFGALSPDQIRTALPMDPIWFSDVPAPFPAVTKGQSGMISQITREAVMQLLKDSAGRLSQKAAEIRLMYQLGFLSVEGMHQSINEAYQNVLMELRRSLRSLCQEYDLEWNDAEFRYLNELLLISCGLGYHLDREDDLMISLLEDTEEADLTDQMHRVVTGEYGRKFC